MHDDIVFVLGTRPEIIKLSPLISLCEQRGIAYSILHTGQHYSQELDDVFFDALELPKPHYNLHVGSANHGEQTGEMMSGIESILLKDLPEVVVVQGDTNSVLAGSLVASKLDCKLGHVEAGLRSFDVDMPEEVNRKLSDHASDLLFPPTEQSKDNLLTEGISGNKITVTGNTVVDAVKHHKSIASEKSDIVGEFGLDGDEFFLITLHRPSNVDDPETFLRILEGIELGAKESNHRVIYPIHPRARKKIEEFSIEVPEEVRTVEPLDYLDFLQMEEMADLIVTDSGGVQEEACTLGTPCVTVRDSTERPETLPIGANYLAGTSPEKIQMAIKEMLGRSGWRNPYGSGDAAEKILDVLEQEING